MKICPETVGGTKHSALNDHKRLTAVKQFLPPRIEAERLAFSTRQLWLHPNPEDWMNVRFSNRTHGACEPQNPSHFSRSVHLRTPCGS